MKRRTNLLLFLIITGIIFIGFLSPARAGVEPGQNCVPAAQICPCPFSCGATFDECNAFEKWSIPGAPVCSPPDKFCCCLCGDDSYAGDSCAIGDLPSCGTEAVWIKNSKCPAAINDTYNGMECTLWWGKSSGARTVLYDPPGETAVWDASDKKCITCDGKVEDQIFADNTTIHCNGVNCLPFAGNGRCEWACGADKECDEAAAGGVCNNCVFSGKPVAAMKTLASDKAGTPYNDTGYFYVPVINPLTLKVVLLFNDSNLEGDQTGTSGEYPTMPDGEVNVLDQIVISGSIGEEGVDPTFKYIGDVNADRSVDVYDLILVGNNQGKTGSYINDLTNVTIEFNVGGTCSVNAAGKCNIPSGATSFIVKKNGAPIGAYVLFYGGAAGPVCAWQNDACGDAPCVATERHQTCGPVGCSGDCDGQLPGSTRCIADPACVAPPAFDFSLSNSGNINVLQGENGSNTITVDYTDGSGTTVTLSVSGLPAGATSSFSPSNTCTGDCDKTLSVQTSGDTPIGTYTITVAGKDGGLTRTTQFDLAVGAPPPTCGNSSLDPEEDCDIGPDLIPGTADDFDAACPGKCQANCTCLIPPIFHIINPLACNTIPECIEKIITFILWVAGAILPIIIIVAGFLFLTSGGDPEKVRTAKRMIFWAIVGLAIVLLAKGIISVIKTVIGG